MLLKFSNLVGIAKSLTPSNEAGDLGIDSCLLRHDGYLGSQRELSHFGMNWGGFFKMTSFFIREIFHALDANNDGCITEDEFVKGCLSDETFIKVIFLDALASLQVSPVSD